jgi:hypothetical protein
LTGEGLEPSTNGLTYRIGFHRPLPTEEQCSDVERVAGLDYPTTIAGAPRLVSEAGTGDPPPPCLLMTQSLAFLAVTFAVAGDVVASRALEGVPAYCGIHSSRFGFFPREAPLRSNSKSVALPTELPGLGTHLEYDPSVFSSRPTMNIEPRRVQGRSCAPCVACNEEKRRRQPNSSGS